jgi:hypothetical protein
VHAEVDNKGDMNKKTWSGRVSDLVRRAEESASWPYVELTIESISLKFNKYL